MQRPKLVSSRDVKPAEKPQSVARAALLLRIEAEARAQTTEAELRYHLANLTRPLLGFRQAFVLRVKGKRTTVEAISSLAAVERDAPLTRWLERITRKMLSKHGAGEQISLETVAYSDDLDPEQTSYPFNNMLWTPLKTAKGEVFAALLLARETNWSDDERAVAKRIAQTYGHAWRALVGEKRVVKSGFRFGRVLLPALAFGAIAAGFIPVPLTAIAPMEVVAEKTTMISAGINGVVEEVLVEPNTVVSEGDVLFTYNTDEVVNAYHVAEREVAVAEARALRARQAAVASAEAKAEVAITMAELEVARAERDYALAQTEKLTVRAPADGIALFGDKREWLGRPVQIGERVMEIAAPGAIQFEVELAVDDAIVLDEGAHVRIFLDTDPLNAVDAKLIRGAYQAEPVDEGRLAYKLTAAPIEPGDELPRIGIRGSAQVFGADAPLALFLFRRPFAAIRQQFGL